MKRLRIAFVAALLFLVVAPLPACWRSVTPSTSRGHDRERGFHVKWL